MLKLQIKTVQQVHLTYQPQTAASINFSFSLSSFIHYSQLSVILKCFNLIKVFFYILYFVLIILDSDSCWWSCERIRRWNSRIKQWWSAVFKQKQRLNESLMTDCWKIWKKRRPPPPPTLCLLSLRLYSYIDSHLSTKMLQLNEVTEGVKVIIQPELHFFERKESFISMNFCHVIVSRRWVTHGFMVAIRSPEFLGFYRICYVQTVHFCGFLNKTWLN